MSQSAVPLLYEGIPIIDALTNSLEKSSTNDTLYPAVQAAAAKGVGVLNKYYSKMDDSIMYCCAMHMGPFFLVIQLLLTAHHLVLNPQYKQSYFRNQKWPAEWIKTAEDILRDHWTTYYKPQIEATPAKSSSVSSLYFTFCSADFANVTLVHI